jgi:hypothetical protein
LKPHDISGALLFPWLDLELFAGVSFWYLLDGFSQNPAVLASSLDMSRLCKDVRLFTGLETPRMMPLS